MNNDDVRIEEIVNEILENDINFMKDIEGSKNYEKFYKKIAENEVIKNYINFEGVLKSLFDYMFAYGIIQSLIEDDEISDINITRYNHVMYKKNGKFYKSEIEFKNEEELLAYCKLIVLRNGGKLNASHNYDRVDDKINLLRISASIPPRSSLGPSISIRKHKKESYDFDELTELKILDRESLSIIERIIKEEKNILVCGRGGAGKTTLLRSIINHMPKDKRFLVCESENELYPQNLNFMVENIIFNDYGKSVNLSDLVRDGLTLSLDGYCIGEIVGPEAWEFIMAGLTDHITYATIHASGFNEAVNRLKMLINSNSHQYSNHDVTQMIMRSLDYIIYMKSFKVMEIAKTIGDDWEIVYRRILDE